MARYHGKIGYDKPTIVRPGVFTENLTEKTVSGDIYKNSKIPESSEGVIDNIKVSMKISFIADPFATENFHLIKYATYNGVPWKVTNVDVEYPRLILTLGGFYNAG